MEKTIKPVGNFPVFKMIFGSFGLFLDNIKSFLLIGSIFSLMIMIINYFGSQSFMCNNTAFAKYAFCSGNLYVYIISGIILWFLCCVYSRIWGQVVIAKKYEFSIKKLQPNKTDLKLCAVVSLFSLSMFIALGSGVLLFLRVPNPDWIIELTYFSFVSIGFFAPMLATPILSLIGYIIEDKKLPSIKELWHTSYHRIVIIFVSFVSVLLLSFLASNYLLQYFMKLSMFDNIFIVVIAEFLYNIMLMFIVSVYTNYCWIQKEVLFERNKNE